MCIPETIWSLLKLPLTGHERSSSLVAVVVLCACVRVRSEHTHLGPSGLIFQNKKTHLPVGVGPAQNLTSVDSRVYFFVASFYLSRIT